MANTGGIFIKVLASLEAASVYSAVEKLKGILSKANAELDGSFAKINANIRASAREAEVQQNKLTELSGQRAKADATAEKAAIKASETTSKLNAKQIAELEEYERLKARVAGVDEKISENRLAQMYAEGVELDALIAKYNVMLERKAAYEASMVTAADAVAAGGAGKAATARQAAADAAIISAAKHEDEAAQMQNAARAQDRLSDSQNAAAASSSRAMNIIGGASALMTAGIFEAAKYGAEFNNQITMMGSAHGETLDKMINYNGKLVSTFDAIHQSVQDTAGETGKHAKDLMESLGYIESASKGVFRGEKAIEIMQETARAALVTGMKPQEVADAATISLMDYPNDSKGKPAKVADRVAMLTEAAKQAGDPGEFFRSFYATDPTAMIYKTPQDQVLAMQLQMTQTGMSSKMAGQEVSNLIASLGSPMAGTRKSMEKFGLSADDIAKTSQSQGTVPALRMITDRLNAMSQDEIIKLENKFVGPETQAAMEEVYAGLSPVGQDIANKIKEGSIPPSQLAGIRGELKKSGNYEDYSRLSDYAHLYMLTSGNSQNIKKSETLEETRAQAFREATGNKTSAQVAEVLSSREAGAPGSVEALMAQLNQSAVSGQVGQNLPGFEKLAGSGPTQFQEASQNLKSAVQNLGDNFAGPFNVISGMVKGFSDFLKNDPALGAIFGWSVIGVGSVWAGGKLFNGIAGGIKGIKGAFTGIADMWDKHLVHPLRQTADGYGKWVDSSNKATTAVDKQAVSTTAAGNAAAQAAPEVEKNAQATGKQAKAATEAAPPTQEVASANQRQATTAGEAAANTEKAAVAIDQEKVAAGGAAVPVGDLAIANDAEAAAASKAAASSEAAAGGMRNAGAAAGPAAVEVGKLDGAMAGFWGKWGSKLSMFGSIGGMMATAALLPEGDAPGQSIVNGAASMSWLGGPWLGIPTTATALAYNAAGDHARDQAAGKPVPVMEGDSLENNPYDVPAHADGGHISGPGTGTSDSIPAWLSNGEHVLTAADVQAMGGQAAVYHFRSALHRRKFDVGGSVYDWTGPGSGEGPIPPQGGEIAGAVHEQALERRWPWKLFQSTERGFNQMESGPLDPMEYGSEGGLTKISPSKMMYLLSLRSKKALEYYTKTGLPTGFAGGYHHYSVGGAVGGGSIPLSIGDVVGIKSDAVADSMQGTPYSQGARTDCSGMIGRLIDQTLGIPSGNLMTTKTAASWLAARGFVAGSGGPGDLRVSWYDHGGGPNSGHMAATLPDGRNAESGGSHGGFLVGDGAAGADSSQFDKHMFLPLSFMKGSSGLALGAGGITGGGMGGGLSSLLGGGGGGGGGAAGGNPLMDAASGGFTLPNIAKMLTTFLANMALGNPIGQMASGKTSSYAWWSPAGQGAGGLNGGGLNGTTGLPFLGGMPTTDAGIATAEKANAYKKAQISLNESIKKHGENSVEATKAAINLNNAWMNLQKTTTKQTENYDKLQEKGGELNNTLAQQQQHLSELESNPKAKQSSVMGAQNSIERTQNRIEANRGKLDQYGDLPPLSDYVGGGGQGPVFKRNGPGSGGGSGPGTGGGSTPGGGSLIGAGGRGASDLSAAGFGNKPPGGGLLNLPPRPGRVFGPPKKAAPGVNVPGSNPAPALGGQPQGVGNDKPGFGISGGILGAAESAATMAAGAAMGGVGAGVAAGGMAAGGAAGAAGGMGGGGGGGGLAGLNPMSLATQEANLFVGYLGKLAGIGVGGLLETFMLNDSPLADPSKSLIGKVAFGIAGAHPNLPNAAGAMQPPLQAQDQQPQEQAGGQPGIQIENQNFYGQQDSGQVNREQNRNMMQYWGGQPS